LPPAYHTAMFWNEKRVPPGRTATSTMPRNSPELY
jgi:hypothetical protein